MSLVRPYGFVAESGKSSETGTDLGSPYTVADDEKTSFCARTGAQGADGTTARRAEGQAHGKPDWDVCATLRGARREGARRGAHLAAVTAHHLEQRQRAPQVVLKVEQRQPHRLSDGLEARKVDDGVKCVGSKERLETILVAEVEADKSSTLPARTERPRSPCTRA
jgi:hypothetical protein